MTKKLKIALRPARVSDIPRIIELECQMALYHHQMEPRVWSKWDKNDPEIQALVRERWTKRKDALLLVLLCDKKVVGYATFDIRSLGRVTAIKKLGYLEKLFVEKPFRKLGLAKMALAKADQWFKKNGVQEIMLQVDIANTGSVKAWRHLGFYPTRYVMRRSL